MEEKQERLAKIALVVGKLFIDNVDWEHLSTRGIAVMKSASETVADADGAEIIVQIAQEWRSSDNDRREEIRRTTAISYADLFASNHKDAPFPYESVYASDERLMMRSLVDDVSAWYKRYDFIIEEEGCAGEPADHAGLEFLFLSHLLDLDVNAAHHFAEERMSGWITRLCDDILRECPAEIYQGLAQFAPQVITAVISL